MRYAVLTDIHANFAALTAVDAEVKQLRVADFDERPIQYWFLGDLVGYGPQPVECIRWLREAAHIDERWVPGNHDEWLIRRDNVTGDAVASLERHRTILDQDIHHALRNWFQQAVREATQTGAAGDEQRSLVVESFEGFTALFVHAAPTREMRRGTYLYPWADVLADEFRRLPGIVGPEETAVVFCGHTHYPMWARWSMDRRVTFESIKYRQPTPLGTGIMFINPGSVGQPRDGDPRAAYLLFDPAERTVEFRRVEYPIWEATAALRADPAYPESLAERLEQANGGINGQNYATIYRRPRWDLEAIV